MTSLTNSNSLLQTEFWETVRRVARFNKVFKWKKAKQQDKQFISVPSPSCPWFFNYIQLSLIPPLPYIFLGVGRGAFYSNSSLTILLLCLKKIDFPICRFQSLIIHIGSVPFLCHPLSCFITIFFPKPIFGV